MGIGFHALTNSMFRIPSMQSRCAYGYFLHRKEGFIDAQEAHSVLRRDGGSVRTKPIDSSSWH